MLKKRKAQGLSITTIIVAVIGLIILVVIIAILTGRMGIFSEGLEETSGSFTKTCGELSGELIDKDEGCGSGEIEITSKDTLSGSGKKCCKSESSTTESTDGDKDDEK